MSKKRILLVKPFIYTCAVFDPIRASQAIGLWFLGSFLKLLGYEVAILDCVLEGFDQRKLIGSPMSYRRYTARKLRDIQTMDAVSFNRKYNRNGHASRPIVRTGLTIKQIVAKVRAFNPDIVGISIFASCNHTAAMETAKAIKKAFPRIKIIAGGSHATDMAEKVLRGSDGAIDICVRGEGFKPFQQIIEGLLPKVGVAYLDMAGNFVDRGEAPRIPFSQFPKKDPALYAHVKLPKSVTHAYKSSGKWTDIMFSRGCNRACPFCVAGSKGYRYQRLSLRQVDEQLSALWEAGYRHLVIQDDDLLRNKRFFFTVLQLMAKYGFSWQDNGGISIEELTPRVGKKIIENGHCTALYVPFNPRNVSVDEAANKAVHKYGVNVEGLKQLRAADIYVYTSGIIGLDIHSKENIKNEVAEYVSLIVDGYVDQALTFPVSHLPATLNFKLFAGDIEDLEYDLGCSIFVPHAKTQKLSVSDVELLTIWANFEYNKVQLESGEWGSGFPKRKAA